MVGSRSKPAACLLRRIGRVLRKQKAVGRGLRSVAELDERIEAATKKGGFSCPSPFMREAIERELAVRERGVHEAEQRIAPTLDRMALEIRNLRIGQRALFAFVDVLAKTFLTYVPEPPRDVQDQAVALGKLRYGRFLKTAKGAARTANGTRNKPAPHSVLPVFLKSVGMAVVGDSQAAMAELLSRGHENRGRVGLRRIAAPDVAEKRSDCLVARDGHS